RVIQCRSRLGFLNEAAFAFGVSYSLRREDFDGDKALQMSITGLVDNAHSTLTELLENAIVRKSLADHDQPDWGTVESDDEGILRGAGGEVKLTYYGVIGPK